MKLDGESACCQTLDKKSTCKSVECNKIVNETDSLEHGEKLEKENQNDASCGLNGNERDVNTMSISSQVNGDVLWNGLEFDCSTSDDSTNANEEEATDFEESYIHSSAQMGLCQNDMVESELPEIVVCYKESHDNVVKDICIDQGVTSLRNLIFEDGGDKGKGVHSFLPPEDDESVSLVTENNDNAMNTPDDLTPSTKQDHYDNTLFTTSNMNSEEKDRCEDVQNNVTDSIKEKDVPESNEAVEHPNTEGFDPGDEVNEQSGQIPYEQAMSKNNESNAIPAPASAAEESNASNANDTKVDEGSITFISDSPAPVHEPQVTQNASKHDDETPDHHTFSNPNRHCPGESSFSMTGPLSGLITYSGPIAYSGSCSLRSESSTTSTRSFAFPVLQGEWNSSPVRMRKAERRKQRNCFEGLLCCRF